MAIVGESDLENMNLFEYPNLDSFIEAVSKRIHAALAEAIELRESASLALSGGGTPMPIYSKLSEMTLDWSSVVAVPTDERWVPKDHPSNNASQIRTFFGGCGIRILGLVPDEATGEPTAEHARDILQDIPVPFDVALLGMGSDAHFASLFPGSPALADGLDPASTTVALPVMPDPLPPEAPFGRISLTLAKLLQSRNVLLAITGENKRAVLDQALHDRVDPQHCPVAALLRAAGDHLDIYWSP